MLFQSIFLLFWAAEGAAIALLHPYRDLAVFFAKVFPAVAAKTWKHFFKSREYIQLEQKDSFFICEEICFQDMKWCRNISFKK